MDHEMFDERYEVVVACTHVTRRIHHQIRYQVYCVEQGYEDPAQYPDQEEHDAWDEHAVHFLVRERSSGEWIGAMRLIRPLDGVLPIGLAAQAASGLNSGGGSRQCLGTVANVHSERLSAR
jgi:N-acyl amino acid synthase of PEP-CTERM/exosortase system